MMNKQQQNDNSQHDGYFNMLQTAHKQQSQSQNSKSLAKLHQTRSMSPPISQRPCDTVVMLAKRITSHSALFLQTPCLRFPQTNRMKHIFIQLRRCSNITIPQRPFASLEVEKLTISVVVLRTVPARSKESNNMCATINMYSICQQLRNSFGRISSTTSIKINSKNK